MTASSSGGSKKNQCSTADTLRALVLHRVSSEPQVDGGGIKAQEEITSRIRDGMEETVSVAKTIQEEGVSGTKFPRASLLDILDSARKDEFDILVVKDVTRIGRIAAPTFAFIWLLNYWFGIDIVVEDGRYNIKRKTDLIQLFFRSVNAELKNRFRTNYVIESQLADFRSGKFHVTGRKVRFGYKKEAGDDSEEFDPDGPILEDESVVIDDDQAEVVKIIYQELKDIGPERNVFASIRERLTDKFGQDRVPDDKQNLREILRNPIYKGRPTWEVDIATKGKQTAVMEREDLEIIDETLFDEVQTILDTRDSKYWGDQNIDSDPAPEILTTHQIASLVGLDRLAAFEDVVRIHCPDCGAEMADNGKWRATSDLKPDGFDDIVDEPLLKRYRCSNDNCERSEKLFPNEFEAYMLFNSDISAEELMEQCS